MKNRRQCQNEYLNIELCQVKNRIEWEGERKGGSIDIRVGM
jgi:hypothetical protein